MPSNSKSFYNQPDYTGEESSGPVIHKPNEISVSDSLPPPPPYSPGSSSSATPRNNQYARDSSLPQEQVGLLSQHQQNRDIKPTTSLNPHIEFPINNNEGCSYRSRGDPGCCRKWCKFLFLSIILSLVIYKFSSALSDSPITSYCGESWQSMPSTVDFRQNIEFVMEGSVTQGQVTVFPLEDRHGGTLLSSIQVFPNDLQDVMSYDIEHPDDDTTRVVVHFPPSIRDDNCIHANFEIRVPYSANRLLIQAHHVNVIVHPLIKDVSTVDIRTSHGNISVGRWTGDSVVLVQRGGGQIQTGALIAKNTIYVESDNGAITTTDEWTAKHRISVKNSNGAIALLAKVHADDAVDVETSNESLQVADISADRVTVQNANGQVQLDGVQAKDQIIVKSSNAPMYVSVLGEKNNRVSIINANADIRAHLTHEFEGRFVMSTSFGYIKITDDEEEIEYQDDLDTIKRGYRKGYGNKGDLSLQTSNANIDVSFDL